MLIQAKMAKSYWAKAAEAATYIYNRTPHSAKGFKTPFKLKYDRKLDISSIKI
jgi:hypothetical protein